MDRNIFGLKKLSLLVIFLISSFSYYVSAQTHHWETVFYSDSYFKYHSSNKGDPGPTWRDSGFDDSGWPEGKGSIGYGDADDNTVISPCISVAIRKTFYIPDTSVLTYAVLSIDYDDAFVAYLNGVEVARSFGLADDYPAYDQLSSNNHEAAMYKGGVPESFQINEELFKSLIKTGNNLLAVQVHNLSVSSSDMSSHIFLSVGMAIDNNLFYPVPDWFNPPSEFATNLPIVIIDTHGKTIPDEPKIYADMKIIFNGYDKMTSMKDSANVYNGSIGIEVRGASSSHYPQKPYGIETRDVYGNNNNVSLLGMPPENDWVLLSHYNEKTFMRNLISYKIFAEMGYYSARARLCEVFLNGQYQGIYLFGEKLKRDRNRINISEMHSYNNSGISLTGGYIFKTDYYNSYNSWLSAYAPVDHPNYTTRFVYYYPKVDSITYAQRNYLSSWVDQFQSVMHSSDFAEHYHEYIDIPSFIDYLLVGELSRNVDSYKKSRWYHKYRDDVRGLLHAGPVWDFDWAWKNINTVEFAKRTDGGGWAYRINDYQSTPSPGWYERLMEDPYFVDMVKCRYTALRQTVLSNASLSAFMDSIYNQIYDAQQRHYERWQILGVRTGAPEVEAPAQTYDEEVQRLRDWIALRLTWLDTNFPGSLSNCTTGSYKFAGETVMRVFPNPALDNVYIESSDLIANFLIIDLSGKVVRTYKPVEKYSLSLDISSLAPGIYLLKIITAEGSLNTKKLIIK